MPELASGARNLWRHAFLLALFTGATIALVCVLRARPAQFELRLEAKTDRPAVLQLYYDSGGGFAERDSVRLKLTDAKDFRWLTFRLTAQRLARLRLDPPSGESVLQIRAAELRTSKRRISIPLERFRPIANIDRIETASASVVVRTTPTAIDPQLGIDIAEVITADGDLNAPRRIIAFGVMVLLLAAVFGVVVTTTELRVRKSTGAMLLFPALCTLVAIVLSLSEINGSSSAALLDYFPDASADAGLLAGSARPVRSDEWLVHTPWLFSQARQSRPFSSQNASVGDQRAALVCNLPVAHWTMAFRPEFWPFLAHVRFETAFAIFWNLKWWLLLCGTYALLLTLIGGNPLLSASGALMLLFTSTVQWWFSTPTLMPDMIGLWAFAVASAFGAVAAPKQVQRAACAAAFVFCGIGFVCCCYPRFQVPLVTTAAPLFIAMVCGDAPRRRWLPFSLAAAVLVALTAIFFWQTRETLFAIRDLRYPGRVLSAGGEESWRSVLRGFLTLDVAEDDFPRGFANVVAASSFLNPLPLLVALQFFRWRAARSFDPVQITLLISGAAISLFAICGIPQWLASATLWSYVTSARVVVPLAVIAVLALCRELSQPIQRLPRAQWLGAGAVVFAIALYATNRALGNYLPLVAVAASWIYFSVAGALIAARRTVAATFAILLPVIAFGAGVNPFNRGVPAYSAPAIVRVMNELAQKYRSARWVVLGGYPSGAVASSLFRTTGANVLSGTIAVPNRAFLHGLDPSGANADIYSRYAAVAIVPAPAGITAPRFTLNEPTVYTIELPLTQNWLRAAGIDGVVLREQPDAIVPSGFREIDGGNGWRFWIDSALVSER